MAEITISDGAEQEPKESPAEEQAIQADIEQAEEQEQRSEETERIENAIEGVSEQVAQQGEQAWQREVTSSLAQIAAGIGTLVSLQTSTLTPEASGPEEPEIVEVQMEPPSEGGESQEARTSPRTEKSQRRLFRARGA